MEAGDKRRVGDIQVTATPTRHGDPKNIGFRLEWDGFTLSYTSDTAYFPELHQYHQKADVLIASVIRPGNEKIRGHLCADEFQELLEETSPKLAIMTHLGMKLITDHPREEAEKNYQSHRCGNHSCPGWNGNRSGQIPPPTANPG